MPTSKKPDTSTEDTCQKGYPNTTSHCVFVIVIPLIHYLEDLTLAFCPLARVANILQKSLACHLRVFTGHNLKKVGFIVTYFSLFCVFKESSYG